MTAQVPITANSAAHGPQGWLRRAGVAAQAVSDDSARWPGGALAALIFVGWLPFVLAVVPLPSAADLAFFGADLYTSEIWPLNAMALVVAIAAAAAVASLLVAMAAVSVLRHESRYRGAVSRAVARVWVVQLVAAIPTLFAIGALLAGIASVAPAEYQSPNIGGSVEVRIAVDVLPLLVLLAVTVLAGQMFAASATRRALELRSLAPALRAALVDLRARPLRTFGVAVATLLVQVLELAVTYALLRVLWSAIGPRLSAGLLGSPSTLLLLVGFVAIWLCLVVAAGVVFAWASAWWTLELEANNPL